MSCPFCGMHFANHADELAHVIMNHKPLTEWKSRTAFHGDTGPASFTHLPTEARLLAEDEHETNIIDPVIKSLYKHFSRLTLLDEAVSDANLSQLRTELAFLLTMSETLSIQANLSAILTKFDVDGQMVIAKMVYFGNI